MTGEQSERKGWCFGNDNGQGKDKQFMKWQRQGQWKRKSAMAKTCSERCRGKDAMEKMQRQRYAVAKRCKWQGCAEAKTRSSARAGIERIDREMTVNLTENVVKD